MSEDNYWWQLQDSDEQWQWEQMHKNSIGKPSSDQQTQSGLPNTQSTNQLNVKEQVK